jgi:sugar transferase (PEP-CTERM/EpsH1 system associated)
MNILVLAGDVPATSEMPGSPRLWNLCRELSARHRIFLAARGQSDERWRWLRSHPDVNQVFADVLRLPEPPMPSWFGRQHHRLRLACHLDTRYQAPEYHRRLRAAITEMVGAQRIDLVHVDGLAMTQYVDRQSGAPLIVDLHDCLTLLYQRIARSERHWWRKPQLHLETRSIGRWERSLAEHFALVVTNSSVDEAALRRLMPAGPVVTIPNGVDCDYFTPGNKGSGSRLVVFTGVMNYGPNVDAARFCADEIFPRVRAQVPDAELWIVGADPVPDVQSLGAREGVRVTGRVADMRPHIEAAGVCVCPMRFGAGMKNKILAAMAMGKPVVSTSVGLEGIDAQLGLEVLRADAPQDFADQVVGVLTSEPLARRLAEGGHRLVTERYSWRARAEALEREIEHACTPGAGAVKI